MPSVTSKDGRKPSKKEKTKREQAAERERAKDERSALVGATIRETLRAIGHGKGRVSIDGGTTWHDKRSIICSGDYNCLTITMPDGSFLQSDVGTIIDREMRKYDARAVEEAEGRIRKIAHALPRKDDHDATITSRDWVWCMIFLMEGDVVVLG